MKQECRKFGHLKKCARPKFCKIPLMEKRKYFSEISANKNLLVN